MAILEALKISGFRGIRDMSIKNLGLINLIVGDNNCGKTSVLEAIQLLRSPADNSLANIYKIARQRESMFGVNTNSIYENFICMFPKNDDQFALELSGIIDKVSVSYRITGTQSRVLLDANELDRITRRQIEESGDGLETDLFEGTVEYQAGGSVKNKTIHMNRYAKISGTTVSAKDYVRIVYVSPFEHLKGNTIGLIVKYERYLPKPPISRPVRSKT